MNRVYRVTVAEEVTLDCLYPESSGFKEAIEQATQRESMAIEYFHQNLDSGRLEGEFYFVALDSARSYALLNLKLRERRLVENMNRVLAYRD